MTVQFVVILVVVAVWGGINHKQGGEILEAVSACQETASDTEQKSTTPTTTMTTLHTCEKGCRCDGSGRWLDVNGVPSKEVYCIPTDAERARYLQERLATANQRIVELEWERLDLLGSLAETTSGLEYMEETNKKLIQIKRQVFSAGDKIVTRLDCRPSTSTPDTAHNVMTYEVSCDLP